MSAIASSEAATRMVLTLNHGAPDYGTFLNAAKKIASDQQLDFLEFVDGDGTILSSAQWPAKFGYKEPAFAAVIPTSAFLRQEEVPDGAVLGLSAIRKVATLETNGFMWWADGALIRTFWRAGNFPRVRVPCFIKTWATGFRHNFCSTLRGRCNGRNCLHRSSNRHNSRGQEAEYGDSLDRGMPWMMRRFMPSRYPDRTISCWGYSWSATRAELISDCSGTSLAQRCWRAPPEILLAILFSGWAAGRVTQPVQTTRRGRSRGLRRATGKRGFR